MIEYVISLIPGDGIGPELTESTLRVLDAAQEKFGIKLKIVEAEAGDGTLAKRGAALPADSLEKIKTSHACLKGPVGESAADVIVKLRLIFDLYANLRPLKAIQLFRWPDLTLICCSSGRTLRTFTKD